MGNIAVPLILSVVIVWSMSRREDVFGAMTLGAKNGLKTVLGILPALIALLPGVYMLRASGFIDALTALLEPVFSFLGIPSETAPLVLLRPLSGSGALAVAGEVMKSSGADSLPGRTAAVMLGSTETTFYVIAVYFGAAGIKKSRHALPSALIADAAGFLAAAFFTRLLF
ncbi:MAG: spore maturation protein [Oscillospiraceae bacterium]|nr:spore maturation protein [Oscillospiraceae bacterium]